MFLRTGGIVMHALRRAPAGASRKAQALAFITDYLLRSGHSPSVGDIAGALGVSHTRAKELVRQLSGDGAIVRAPGAQRAISVPGLTSSAVLERLRAEGWRVNPETRTLLPPGSFPQGHLPLVPDLDHLPSIEIQERQDGSQRG